MIIFKNQTIGSFFVVSLTLLLAGIAVVLFTSELYAADSSSKVIRVFPPDGYKSFHGPAYISARFSEPLENSTVTESTFTVRDSAGNKIPGKVTMVLGNGKYDPRFAMFKTQSPLSIKGSDQKYTVRLDGIKDLVGNSIASHEWSFTVLDPSNMIINKGDLSQVAPPPPGENTDGTYGPEVRDHRKLPSEVKKVPKKVPFSYRSGFSFRNDYETTWTRIPDKYIPDFIYEGDIEFTTQGLCGGMAYAALDFYYANKIKPYFNSLPPNDHPISEYIRDRLKDSLDVSFFGVLKALASVGLSTSPISTVSSMEEAPRFLYLTFAPDENKNAIPYLGCKVGCIPGMRPLTNIEVNKATRALDQGTPVVLGLIAGNTMDSLKKSHQVVAYKYTLNKELNNRYVFYIYDSNFPGQELKATWHPSNVGGKLYYSYETFDKNGFVRHQLTPWRGFFVEDYTPQIPPDIVSDRDFDGIADSKDNCLDTPNPDQKNTNQDEFGDACQKGDQDKDGVIDSVDNCRWVANPDQKPGACKDIVL